MDTSGKIELRCLNKSCYFSLKLAADTFEDETYSCPSCHKTMVSEIDVIVFGLLVETGISTEDYSK